MLFQFILFLVSVVSFWFAAELLIKSLIDVAKFLKWREFAVAFFAMAFAASLPNLIVGLSAGFRGVPELAFGDVSGNNIAILTLGLGLAVLMAKGGIPAESKMVQTSSIFTAVSALLPIILIFDGVLSRIDGFILIGFFVFYISWLFSKQERFTKIYDKEDVNSPLFVKFKSSVAGIANSFFGLIIFIIAGQGIVISAQYFSEFFSLSLVFIGVLITGLSSALPEIYFGVVSAKKEQTWMILGNVMGAAIIPATLVLGIVAIIYPIQIHDFSTLAVARLFIVISALFFLFFIRSKQKIDKKEGLVLILIYIIFLIVTVFFHNFLQK